MYSVIEGIEAEGLVRQKTFNVTVNKISLTYEWLMHKAAAYEISLTYLW